MTRTDTTDWVREVGGPCMDSIVQMVRALECDYDRLYELVDEQSQAENEGSLPSWEIEYGAELAELKEQAGECKDSEDASEVIWNDPLSVMVRSGWYSPCEGGSHAAEEYEILLTTGGPAARIRGELEDGVAISAKLEVQDWVKPWTEYDADDDEREALLTYARHFFFGE